MNKKWIATLTLSALLASSLSLQAGAATDKQLLKDETGTLHTIVGQLGTVSGQSAESRALQALDLVKSDYGFTKAKDRFQAKSSRVDELGVTHTRLAQVIDGIPVYGQEMIVHEADGRVQGITGTYLALTPNAKRAELTSEAAVDKALAHIDYDGDLVQPATGELVYLPQDGQALLTYAVEISHLGDQPARWLIFLNAEDGTVIQADNLLANVAAVGTGKGVLGDTKTLQTNLNGSLYYLEDISRSRYATHGFMIRTRDARNGTSYIYNLTDTDNVWNTTYQQAAVDAHYYMGYTYEKAKTCCGHFDWNQITGKNMEAIVHYSRNYNNAFWNGSYLVFGDGDGTTFLPLSGALDIVAHELYHAVIDHTAGLVYQNQSGALSESWADAFAACIDGDDWLMAEDVYTPGTAGDAIRSLSSPSLYGDPEHMSQYINTTSDNGGIHSNMGIPNKAFYNFATAIGSRCIAMDIWHRALVNYMTSNTTFSGARAATLQACADLYGTSSSYYTALKNAWDAVGVY